MPADERATLREIADRIAKKPLHPDTLAKEIESALKAEGRRAREDAVKCAEAEEELEGDPPDGMIERIVAHPAEALRAAVRTTKHGIIERIRASITTDEGMR